MADSRGEAEKVGAPLLDQVDERRNPLLGSRSVVQGVTAVLVDAGPMPTVLVAVTVIVYVVPLVRPVMVHPVLVVVQVAPPGEAVAVYPVTAAPPFQVGAVQVTAAEVVPGVAAGVAGAAGVRVEPHLRAWYSSMSRRSAAVSAPVKTMTSGMARTRRGCDRHSAHDVRRATE